MDSDRSQFPCMPTPTMPKRTRSLAGTAAGIRLRGSGTIECAASDAPAAAAIMPRNSRREQLFSFTAAPRHVGGPILCTTDHADRKVRPCETERDKGGRLDSGRGWTDQYAII